MIERIESGGKLLAMVIRHQFQEPGVHFISPPELSQQLAYMRHPRGKIIKPHIHNRVDRNIELTQEVLVLRRGRLRADIYDDNRSLVTSLELTGGDVMLLASGGHGFEVLEEIEMIEIKQGPYIDDRDKTHFEPRKD